MAEVAEEAQVVEVDFIPVVQETEIAVVRAFFRADRVDSSRLAGSGGFGGGGGGAQSRLWGGGGGGGYFGGSGGEYSCGGGGGSYNVGRNQQNNLHNWTSSGHGMVDITFLGNN